MTLQKGLRNRIRGWFPQDPRMNKTVIANTSLQNTQTTSIQELKKEVIFTRQAEQVIAFASCFFGLLANLPHLPLAIDASLIGIGVIIGVIVRIAPGYRELKQLSINGSSSVKFSEVAFLFSVLTGFGLGLLVPIILAGFNLTYIQAGLAICLSSFIANLTSKDLLFRVWERKNKVDIMGGKGFTIFSIPKNPSRPRYDIFGRRLK